MMFKSYKKKNYVQESEISESSSTAIASVCKRLSTAHTDPSSSTICSQSSSLLKPHPSPGHHFSGQITEGRVLTLDSLNEEDRQSFSTSDSSAGESHGGSPDGWSIRSFSELIVSSQRDSSVNTLSSSSFSSDLQTCGLCSKLLKEGSSWKGNDTSITAVLICGHVYHAECLETVTPEASKFDPSCPSCSHGEKSSAGKALVKAYSKTRNKISRRAVADIDVDGNFILQSQKSGSCIAKDLRLGAGSSGKSSFGRSFLRRHFSFGSRSIKLAPERECSRKKGFWVRYR